MADDPPASRSRLLPMLVVAVVAAFATWRIVGAGMGGQLARHDPSAALAWHDQEARAHRGVALAAQRAQQRERALRHARAALVANPLDGRAFAVLGRIVSDDGPVTSLMSIATRRWPLDPAAHAALADHHLREGEVEVALKHLDALLRVQPESRRTVFPLLTGMIAHLGDVRPFAAWLGEGPAWRAAFLAHATRSIEDVDRMFALMQGLQVTAAPPTEAELRAWLARLERDGRYADAWFSWLASLPPERIATLANLQNGSFEFPPSGHGFDWRIGRVPGASIERALSGGGDGDFALRLSFRFQRVDFRHVSQLLLLPPGRWQLGGRVRLDALRNDFGLGWQIDCAAPRGAALGQSEAFRGTSAWRSFAFDFEVPASDCPAQWLRLQTRARAAADTFIGGDAWFDAMHIRRIGDAEGVQ